MVACLITCLGEVINRRVSDGVSKVVDTAHASEVDAVISSHPTY
jgi:hypothetical protein